MALFGVATGTLGRLGGMAVLAFALSGCMDAQIDVALTSGATAEATVTQVMSPDFYALLKMNAAPEGDAPSFCDTGTLRENRDGSARCVLAEAGRFDRLSFGSATPSVTFERVALGVVRVALPSAAIKGRIGADEAMDGETRDMVLAFFKGHKLTFRVSGTAVIDTNMTPSADGTAAETEIDFTEVLEGSEDLPVEFYAIVRVPR